MEQALETNEAPGRAWCGNCDDLHQRKHRETGECPAMKKGETCGACEEFVPEGQVIHHWKYCTGRG